MDPRLTGTKKALGENLLDKILKSRILVVGAGGIGCELLKNLVLTGFSNIDIIDLDTIDTSNLNRQFLFQKPDVGKSKSIMASHAALKYNPNVKITPFFGNVKDAQFGPSYVAQFDLVMNALDNLSARRHVNSTCLSAGVPLIESGTAGYLGQVQVIKGGVSECYECVPQPPPKTFPICTIRLNPSTAIHCIVWAQSIFKRFFGIKEDGDEIENEDDMPNLEGTEMTEEDKKAQEELTHLLEQDKSKLKSEKEISFARWLFHKMFHTDVLYLSSLKSLWEDKVAPVPIVLSETEDQLDEKFHDISSSFNSSSNFSLIPDQKVWSPKENAIKFLESAKKLHDLGIPEKWEKDNQVHLDFVTSAANLRACVFHLDLSSRFFVKEKAGNIIPAIATTNAITAGLIVMKAFKILDGRLKECQNTYLRKQPNRGTLFLGANLDPPNPDCYVCSKNMCTVKINTEKMTLRYFVEEIVKKDMKMEAPMIGVGNLMIYDLDPEEDDEIELEANEKQLKKIVNQTGILHNVTVDLTDIVSDLTISLTVIHDSSKNENDFTRTGDIKIPVEKPKVPEIEEKKTEEAPKTNNEGVVLIDDEDDMLIVEDSGDKKRKAEEEEFTNDPQKKRKL